MATATKTRDFVSEIINGDYDDDFPTIQEAMKARIRALAAGKSLSFKVGDKVRFNASASPKYLNGVEGIVTKVNTASVVVKIGADGGRFAHSTPRCPLSIVDKVG